MKGRLRMREAVAAYSHTKYGRRTGVTPEEAGKSPQGQA